MGYRSEVAIEIDVKNLDKLDPVIKSGGWDCDERRIIRKGDFCHVIYVWHDVKWYESYPYVKDIEHAMRGLDEWCFVKLGEDDDDNTFENTFADGDICLSTIRKITLWNPTNDKAEILTTSFDKQFYTWE